MFAVEDVARNTIFADGEPAAGNLSCFTLDENDPPRGALNSIIAWPRIEGKFPAFLVQASGKKYCLSGQGPADAVEDDPDTVEDESADAIDGYPNTFDIGCSADSGQIGTWQ